MAQQLSTRLTAATTLPNIPGKAPHSGSDRTITDTIEAADGANADTAIFAIEIPVGAKIHSVKIASDDLGTGTTMEVGLYSKNADNTFTAIDDDCFVTDLDVAAAAIALTERRFTVKDINTVNQVAWELAGLSARPSYPTCFLGISFPVGTTAVGTVSAMVTISSPAQ